MKIKFSDLIVKEKTFEPDDKIIFGRASDKNENFITNNNSNVSLYHAQIKYTNN